MTDTSSEAHRAACEARLVASLVRERRGQKAMVKLVEDVNQVRQSQAEV